MSQYVTLQFSCLQLCLASTPPGNCFCVYFCYVHFIRDITQVLMSKCQILLWKHCVQLASKNKAEQENPPSLASALFPAQCVKEEVGKWVSDSTAGPIHTFLQEKEYHSSKTYTVYPFYLNEHLWGTETQHGTSAGCSAFPHSYLSCCPLSFSSARMISQQVYLSCKHVGCRSNYAHSPTHTVMQAEKDKGMFCWHGSNAAKIKNETGKRRKTEM